MRTPRFVLPSLSVLIVGLSGCSTVQFNPNAQAAISATQTAAFPADVMSYTCREELGEEPAKTASIWNAVLSARGSTYERITMTSLVRHTENMGSLIDIHVCPDAITGAFNKLSHDVNTLDLAVSAEDVTEQDYDAVGDSVSAWTLVTAPEQS